jgi:hypothetical protein
VRYAVALIARLGGSDGGPQARVDRRSYVASHLFSGVIPRCGRVHTPANQAWLPVADGEIVPADSAPRAPVPLLLGSARAHPSRLGRACWSDLLAPEAPSLTLA